MLVVQDEAAGPPLAIAVGAVNRSFHATARLEHQLQHAAGTQHPGKLRQHSVEHCVSGNVLNHSVAQHDLETVIVKGRRILDVGNLQAAGKVGMQLEGDLDVLRHRIQAEHFEPQLGQIRHLQRAGAASSVQPSSRAVHLRQP